MTDFTYPDVNDALTVELIDSSFNSRYWEESERNVLNYAKEYMAGSFDRELKKLSHLDLGCGEGRLIPEFAEMEASVTGLDPDSVRLERAKETVSEKELKNVLLFNDYSSSFLEKFPETCFDTVLCSHIFQHISHDITAGILEDLGKMTSEDSVIIITTTFAAGEENIYSKEYFSEGKRVSEITDISGFEEAMGNVGTLPVCRFSRSYFEKLLKEKGFETVYFAAYHFEDADEASQDRQLNQSQENLSKARDAFYIVKKSLPKVSGKVTFCQYFFESDGVIDQQLLEEKYENSMTEDRLAVKKDFDICEGFLYGGGLHFQTHRYYTGDMNVKVHAHDEILTADHAHAIVSIYPQEAMTQVSVCINFEDVRPQDLIFMHHIQNSPADFFEIDGSRTSVPEWCRRLLEDCRTGDPVPASTGFIAEINKIGDHQKPEGFSDMVKKMLYGILTGDEGFGHVPLELAERRLSSCWTSRDFVSVIPFGNNVLSLNLNRSETEKSYIEWQQDFAGRYYGGLNEYFTMKSTTGGICHGVFHSLETGLLIKTTADMLMARRPDLATIKGRLTHNIINVNKRYRADMIRALEKLEMIGISELGELDNLVASGLNLSGRIASLQEILELLESELDLMYSTNTNTMVTCLTVVGLLFSLAQVILAIKG